MNYYVRVAIGLVLGLALVGVSSLFVAWWLVAPIAALFAMMAFLSTFFVWTADTPEKESVLFDGPNLTHGLGLSIVMILAAFGGSFIGGEKTSTPPVDPMLVAMDNDHDALVKVYNEVQAAKLDARGSADARTKVVAVQSDLAKLTQNGQTAKLDTAAKALLAALTAYDSCGEKACQQATLALLDAKGPLDAYAAG